MNWLEKMGKKNKSRKTTCNSAPAPAREPPVGVCINMGKCSEFLRLKDYCSQNHLGEPVVKAIPILTNKVKNFTCKIQVGAVAANDPTYRAKTVEDAVNHVARLTLEKLYQDAVRAREKSIYGASNCDQKTLLDRISKILVMSETGFRSSKVEEIYLASYGEKLPHDWFTFAMGCDVFETLSPISAIIGLAPKFELPALELPFGSVWNVMVTAIEDTDKVWVQFTDAGYSDLIYSMLHEVKNAVDANAIGFGMTKVHTGSILLARLANSLTRVKVLVADTNRASCEMIDLGGTMMISLDDLTHLPYICRKLAPQALLVKLHGVEHFANLDPKIVEVTRQLMNIVFSALHKQEANERPSLVLYTFGNTEGKSVNSALVDDIANNLYKPGFELASCGQVIVSHAASEMEICVQTQPVVVSWLYKELTAACINANILQEDKPTFMPVDIMYVVIVDNGDNKFEPFLYRRGLLLEIKKAALCTMTLVFLVDTGETIWVPENRIRNFPCCPFDFTLILPQATKCLLGGYEEQIPLTFEQLKHLEMSRCTVNLRVLSYDGSHKLPLVQIAP
ncbi:uncharacterized protein LOC135946764 [Cloeon dipterum]|uniref:uncharacterized protein LOC135946764 n=1 Tax=Cloeon dipterum TaxID=197152 RepID=UPI00322016A9